MAQHLKKLRKALADHAGDHEMYMASHNALHKALGEAVAGLKADTSSPIITGHLGHVAKVAAMHQQTYDLLCQSHKMLHGALDRAATGIASATGEDLNAEDETVSGAPAGRVNPNVRTARGDMSVTEDSTGQMPLSPPAGKAMTGKQMQEAMDRLQKSMPVFGSCRRTGRVNPNSLGNPHWTGRN